MNKSIRYFKYANEYIKCLNTFYDKHINNIDECILNDEYDLMINILDDLTYDNHVSWCVNFERNQYRKHIIYKTDKKYWKTLSKLYRKMLKATFGF